MLFLVFFLIIILILSNIALKNLMPILTSMATARVSNVVNRIVNEAVDDAIIQGDFEYDDLITIEKDNDGKVTALKSNMVEFNRLQSEIMSDILERMNDVTSSELAIPVGSLTGITVLASRGPKIHVKMSAVGSPTADFENLFTSAGINQTKHQIVLNIDVNVSILLTGIKTSTVVSNSLAVAETIIVGNVPNSYMYFNTDDDTAREIIGSYAVTN
ncbi:MAG: sporulation protein YunB [Oscillospiraceae bacterium]|nr:sporulation protein YunB [Oscillospiraceae bacterium]